MRNPVKERLVGLAGILLASLLLVLPTQTCWATDLRWSPSKPRVGEPFKVVVEGASNCDVFLYRDGNQLPTVRRGDRHTAWLGAGLENKADTIPLLAKIAGCNSEPSRLQRTVSLRPGSFRVQHLTMEDESKVTLSDTDLRRHRREKRAINRVLNRTRSERFWSFPFHSPVEGARPGDSFGARRVINGQPRSPHGGEDYGASIGDPIRSINDGIVSLTGDFFFGGKSVFVDHGHGLHSYYLHLSKISVREGTPIKGGDVIGEAGRTGRATGPHLHLGVEIRGHRVDPDAFLFEQSIK